MVFKFVIFFIICIKVIYGNHDNKDYAIIIDAGSTGSRAFVFEFSLENGVRKVIGTKGMKVTPGLSSFGDNPKKAISYFEPLLIDCTKFIPKSKLENTQLFIKGTAGMRLLEDKKQEDIWNELINGLKDHPDIPFKILRSNLGTIDGHSEAYYAVLSSNYIAGSIDGNLKRIPNVEMVGALDMGGSSTQLIFHTYTKPTESVKSKDFWSHSWLNYGVEVMRDKVHDYLINHYENSTANNRVKLVDNILLKNPCTFSGHEFIRDQYIIKGYGDGVQCVDIIKKLVWNNYDEKCNIGKACSVDDITHPDIKGHFYGMSVYFYALDCIRQLGPETLNHWPNPSINELEAAAHKFCEFEWSIVESTMIPSPHKYTRDDQIVNRCLEGLYLVTLLEYGFGFDGDARDITLALEIEGHEVEWTLGFALSEVSLPLIDVKKIASNSNSNNNLKQLFSIVQKKIQIVISSIKAIIISIFLTPFYFNK